MSLCPIVGMPKICAIGFIRRNCHMTSPVAASGPTIDNVILTASSAETATLSSEFSDLPGTRTSHPLITIVGLLVRTASAISLSVPQLPPTTITASALLTTRPLRSSPRPVGKATERKAFPFTREFPGRSPTVIPPSLCAPRHTASMTPPSPPQITMHCCCARSLPSRWAVSTSDDVAASGPTTATYGALRVAGEECDGALWDMVGLPGLASPWA